MNTCRECLESQELFPYNSKAPKYDRQNVYCNKFDTVEPVFGWFALGTRPNAVLRKVEAPSCFTQCRAKIKVRRAA